MYRLDDGTEVPVITVMGTMPDNGSAVVISDESGIGSLWIEWEHHGEVKLA